MAAAIKLDSDNDGADRGAAFTAVWTMFLVLLFAVGGTLVLRKYRTNMMFGFFLGVSGMLSQTMFLNFAIFAGLADAKEGSKAADITMSFFSFCLWVIITIFTAVLVYDRAHILDGGNAAAAAPAVAAPKLDLEPPAPPAEAAGAGIA